MGVHGLEAPSTPECLEGVPSPGGEQKEGPPNHVQVEHYKKNW